MPGSGFAGWPRLWRGGRGPIGPGRERLTVGGFGGDVVGGAGPLVVVGDHGAHELGGVAAGAAASRVHTGGGLGVFVLALPVTRSYR